MTAKPRIDLCDGHLAVNADDDAVLRVLFFPHAGGSALSPLPLAAALPAGAEARLFELPGRGARAREPRPGTFDEACRGLLAQVRPLLDRPVILFGHSLGGLLCDGLVRRLPPPQRARVVTVIVSCAPSPRAALGAGQGPGPAPRRTRADLLDRLLEHGGTPADVLDDPDLADSVLDAFGDDMLLMDSYVLDPADPVPDVDYQLWTARHDASAAGDLPEAWLEAVARPLDERIFPGGHFYLTEGPEARAELRALVRAQLARLGGPGDREARG